MPVAKVVAARMFGSRVDDSIAFSDYLQYARLGLVEAVDRYDPQREASFETFSSYRIRGAILNGLGKESEIAAQRTFWRTRTQERMESLKPAAFSGGGAELDALVDLTVGLALGLLLDESAEAPADESVAANPYAATELSQMRVVIRRAVEKLPERERDLVTRHYFGQREFQSIAADLGVTKGRVSQLHAQALARIRQLLGPVSDVDFSL
jgi:RNA polymerase sigma factor for flagellar operon FliA